MTFDERQSLLEDDLSWKMTLNGRQPLMKDNCWWKTTFDKNQVSIEDISDSAVPYLCEWGGH